MVFDTLIAIGTIALLAFIAFTLIAWAVRHPVTITIARNATLILRIVFVGAVLGSLIYSEFLNYPPCILCWYQRLAIFPIAIILFTGSLKNFLIRQQVLLFSILGFLVALFHNYIDIFPSSSLEVCGADGISCSARYVYEFGFVTIPLMSGTVLLAALVLSLLAKRYPQE